MHILIYGNDRDILAEMIESSGAVQYRKIAFSLPVCYEEFLSELKRITPHVILISQDGAVGMEAVIAAKNLYPQTDVIWFSDDEGFGPQSYRLGCSYFAIKPVTADKMQRAFAKC